ncbi:MAG: glycosyltransferase family 2 protein [Bryobacteraceae bacterium]
MRNARITVAIPTLAADSTLLGCLEALGRQTLQDWEAVVVDNSGKRLAREILARVAEPRVRSIENETNAGFGRAVNQVYDASQAPYLAALNDDAVPHPEWLQQLIRAMEERADVGMGASQVRLAPDGALDSAGMLICADGSSKQRGHRAPPARFSRLEEVLLPSGSAALYRRQMLDEIGGFDDRFFLYCEDTDLGLRAQRAGWRCLYVPGAVVEHRYSHTAGRASPLKAYYVERNRLFVLFKNFPAREIAASPFISAARYAWHLGFLLRGKGTAARYRDAGHSGLRLVWLVVAAHAALFRHAAGLIRDRRRIRRTARISDSAFRKLLRSHAISAREVAEL